MRLSNELFARAVYWLIDKKKVEDQQELSKVTGITETTISRILNDKVKKPSQETIRKLLDAFPDIFNPSYFWGEDIYMIMEDKMEAMMETAPIEKQQDALTYAAIQVGKTMAKLEEKLERVTLMEDALKERLDKFDRILAAMSRYENYHIPGMERPFDIAAEKREEQKKAAK